MKTWMKVVLGFIVFIGIAVSAGLYFTGSLVDTADAFFKALKDKDMTTARSYLAEEFKAAVDEKTFTRFLSDTALLDYKEGSWGRREINNNRGTLEGSIITTSGGVIQITLTFVNENDGWKIYSIDKAAAGLVTNDAPAAASAESPVPSKAAQVDLVKTSMRNFIVSINQQDMAHFRSTLSELWQDQYTTEMLDDTYRVFIDSPADWSELNGMDPVISGAVVQDHGVLALTGHYATNPGTLTFNHEFITENGAWKLVGFGLTAK